MIASEMKKPPAFRGVILRCEIIRLKHLAKKHYEAYVSSYFVTDCGHALSKYIRPSISRHAIQYNKVMEQLEELDPDCPEWTAIK